MTRLEPGTLSDRLPVTLSVTVAPEGRAGSRLLAPVGLATPHSSPVSFAVEGAPFTLIGESGTGQAAALASPLDDSPVTFRYGFVAGGPDYPQSLFVHRANRYTRAAHALIEDARCVAAAAGGGGAGLTAVVNDVAAKFTYGHPETRFYDGADNVPALCGMTEGSCIDINTYLIASLRAAGYEAGYVTGYFFPAEKAGRCDDMHCWVVTRQDGVLQEWDIAHHLKLGEREIRPALNPKPGARVAVAHSMGLDFPALGIREMKLLGEPVWIDAEGRASPSDVTIRLENWEKVAVDPR